MRKFLSALFTLFLLTASFQIQALSSNITIDGDSCATEILAKRSTAGVILQADTKGTAPFKFNWSTGETTQRILVTKPGKYCVKVEDANGCLSSACFEIKDDTGGDRCVTEITALRTGTGVKLSARTKGTAPFKYSWSTGETTQTILATKPGKYCVKVVDADGCVSSACFEIKDDTGNDDCKTAISAIRSGTGEVKLTANTRGTAPFKYAWSNGETTQSIIVKKPGKYCVKVIDADDCVSSACFEIKDDTGNDKCKTIIRLRRSAAGAKLVARTKGTAPFKYSWSTGETTQGILVTKSGKYCVKVEDANGCTSSACFEVKIKDRGDEKCKTIIQEDRTPTQVKGRKLTARTKGKAPFSYKWSTGETTQSIVVTKPGKYCVKVLDANGCFSTACIEVKDRNPNNDQCKTTIVAFRSDVAGKQLKLFARTFGKAPFMFYWNTGDTTQSIHVSKPGKYCVKVKDATGCVSTACFEVKDDTGNDDCKTEITAIRTGAGVKLMANAKGKAPFKYQWSNGETSKSIFVDKPGKYCVRVVDANGCTSSACFEVKDDTGGDRCKTEIKVTKSPDARFIKLLANTIGKAPFKYEWSTGQTTQAIRVTDFGKYCVTVKDADGCVSKACFEYKKGGFTDENSSLEGGGISLRSGLENNRIIQFNIYPNPVVDLLNMELQTNNDQPITYAVYDVNGQLVLSDQLMLKSGLNSFNISVNNLYTGQYFINIISNSGVETLKFNKF